jgi:hypothetical protein
MPFSPEKVDFTKVMANMAKANMITHVHLIAQPPCLYSSNPLHPIS